LAKVDHTAPIPHVWHLAFNTSSLFLVGSNAYEYQAWSDEDLISQARDAGSIPTTRSINPITAEAPNAFLPHDARNRFQNNVPPPGCGCRRSPA
jgi:hypothetical protein